MLEALIVIAACAALAALAVLAAWSACAWVLARYGKEDERVLAPWLWLAGHR